MYAIWKDICMTNPSCIFFRNLNQILIYNNKQICIDSRLILKDLFCCWLGLRLTICAFCTICLAWGRYIHWALFAVFQEFACTLFSDVCIWPSIYIYHINRLLDNHDNWCTVSKYDWFFFAGFDRIYSGQPPDLLLSRLHHLPRKEQDGNESLIRHRTF